MTDLNEMARLIREVSATRGQPISKLGYFCAPFRPQSGPFSHSVIKVYRGLADEAVMARLANAHADYVDALVEAGVPVPRTAFHLLPEGDVKIPVIVQEALAPETMMRPQMQAGSVEEAVRLMEAAGQVIAAFWNHADKFKTRIGFHPSIRNFAVQGDGAVFFDTFPPLIHYSREEMGEMLLSFSDSTLMRALGPLFKSRVTAIQDEWYSASETLVGLVGSACRLRPDDAGDFLSWGCEFANRAMPRWADEALPHLQRPPRLPGYWTGMRRVLGLQGQPNV